jgi:hypothetical protein
MQTEGLRRHKRISELPHFKVSEVREGVLHRGTVEVNLVGTFDTLDGVDGGRCSLILPSLESIWCEPLRFDAKTGSAVYLAWFSEMKDVAGESLAYVNGRVDGEKVAMIADESNVWTKLKFEPSDAIANSIIGTDGKPWTALRKANSHPASGQERVVKNGWNHEHCKLCNASIGAEQCGYRDSTQRWICELCFERYAKGHNISFLDEL